MEILQQINSFLTKQTFDIVLLVSEKRFFLYIPYYWVSSLLFLKKV